MTIIICLFLKKKKNIGNIWCIFQSKIPTYLHLSSKAEKNPVKNKKEATWSSCIKKLKTSGQIIFSASMEGMLRPSECYERKRLDVQH